MRRIVFTHFVLAGSMLAGELTVCRAQTGSPQLENELAAEDATELAKEARSSGDATRGAIVFYQQHVTCTKCHTAGEGQRSLGPDLAKMDDAATDVYLIESVLTPSKVIKKGYESFSALTLDGKDITGLLVENSPEKLVLRDATEDGKLIELPKSELDEFSQNSVSIMPKGLVAQLSSRQQFLDLVRYLMEVAEGGATRALQLKPDPSLYVARPLPEYEKDIDHAGMIKDLDQQAFRRGEAIYSRLCVNCHGTHDQPGSLPTSLRFASGKFKNGNDPYTMYQTLTHGFGMMVPQMWMVPQQKYDAIHYIREAYLKTHNPLQYAQIGTAYLERLPKGTTRGPKPVETKPWEEMNRGPNLIATYEIPTHTGHGRDGPKGPNLAYKGIAVRLDPGPGGVSRARHWMVFDHDTLRMAAAWSGEGFIDWNQISFNGRHAIHPKIVGQVDFANPIGPGWANPDDGGFEDPRLRGRDDRPYGPLPRRWAKLKGLYHHGQNVIISYTVGNVPVLEMPGLITATTEPVYTRALNIGPREKDMVLQVARQPAASTAIVTRSSSGTPTVKLPGSPPTVSQPKRGWAGFDGNTHLQIARPGDFDMTGSDYTIYARVKTDRGGTLFAKTVPGAQWVQDGKTLFIRGGQLVFDIGWVGAVHGRTKITDGKWHDVALRWEHESGQVRLYVDGRLDGQGRLKPHKPLKNDVVRIGFTAPDFPKQQSCFAGDIAQVRFYGRALSDDQIAELPRVDAKADKLIARWDFGAVQGETVPDTTGNDRDATIVAGSRQTAVASQGLLVAGLAGQTQGVTWQSKDGNLQLRIPSGSEPLKFTLWLANVAEASRVEKVASVPIDRPAPDLSQLTKGGPPRWPTILETKAKIGAENGPFAIDVLTPPEQNPWFCMMRLTGFDFYPDGDRMAISSWDGDVWLVRGLSKLAAASSEANDTETNDTETNDTVAVLTWQRIASGLFQPLGVKIVDDRIHVTCRDQLVILHDLNDDGETDFYENFNNDHQVTEHFHEFAMGLQTDSDGNFYYAKSARHARPALVPHHGTLLRISKDGLKTEILANGFRAANGICINADGTFIVTDQEGHWTPKNRINWVKKGGFYGNMLGYHDVTDTSDDAMEQPLCWITNAFDRSPAELLWVTSKAWGPLHGSLLNFSYGYGQIYVVPHERVDGQTQGGMCALPIPRFPTGVMRGRFHPNDGQLYTCGMFAWAGSQHKPGGLYRVRYTGKPVHLPVHLHATTKGMSITFSGELDREAAAGQDRYAVKIWSLRRAANYGSKHYDERSLKVAAADVSDDGKTVFLEIPDIQPTWCMEIKYALQGADGEPVTGTIHNTVHHLGR